MGSCVPSLSLATNPASSSKTRLVMSGPLRKAKNASFQTCSREITSSWEKIEANPRPANVRIALVSSSAGSNPWELCAFELFEERHNPPDHLICVITEWAQLLSFWQCAQANLQHGQSLPHFFGSFRPEFHDRSRRDRRCDNFLLSEAHRWPHGQTDRDRRADTFHAGKRDFATMQIDNRLDKVQPYSRSHSVRSVRAAIKSLKQARNVARRYSHALIPDRYGDSALISMRADFDRRIWLRILDRVCQNVAEDLEQQFSAGNHNYAVATVAFDDLPRGDFLMKLANFGQHVAQIQFVGWK